MEHSSCYHLPNLPSHLIIHEILTRTSPQTIARSRTVCKEWNDLTYKSAFLKTFHRRTNTVSGFLTQFSEDHMQKHSFVSGFEGSKEPEMSLSFMGFDEERTEIVASAPKQGLILCVRSRRSVPRSDHYIVSKPATKQCLHIPKPKTRHFSVRHAMVVTGPSSLNPDQLRYKIVRFSCLDKLPIKSWAYVYRCEFFDSERWAWRESPKLVECRYAEFLCEKSAVVSTAGFAYALTTGLNNSFRVLVIDWEAETFEFTDLPDQPENVSYHRLVEWEGKLGLTRLFESDSGNFFELWVYDQKSRVWTLKRRTSLESFVRGDDSPLDMLCGDLAVIRSFSNMCFYKFGLDNGSSGQVVKTSQNIYSALLYGTFFKIESDTVRINNMVDKFNNHKKDKIKKKKNCNMNTQKKKKKERDYTKYTSILNSEEF